MKIIRSSPGIGFLDSRYVNVTGDTMTGALGMGYNYIQFGDTDTRLSGSDSPGNSGFLMLDGVSGASIPRGFLASGNLRFWANAGSDGLGDYAPSFRFEDTGVTLDGSPTIGGVGVPVSSWLVEGTLTEAASGNHPLLAGLHIGTYSIVPGDATVTNSATLYIQESLDVTVTGANYALWVDAGDVRFDGNILPGADSASDLGSSTPLYFANAYIDKVYTAEVTTPGGTDLVLNPVTNIVSIGPSPTNDRLLRFYQGSGGTSGYVAEIRADFDGFYLTNVNGRVWIEKAADEAHALGIQEAASPFEKVSWWFDGSSATGTGVWMQANANAGDINFKLGAADAATYALKVVDWFDRDVVTINSLGGASFNILLKDADFIIAGDTNANCFTLDASNDNITINATAVSANYDLMLAGDGVLGLKETTTPTADTNYGKVYTKSDNNFYFQDGAGTEKTLLDSEDTMAIPLLLATYDAEPTRSSVSNIHGGLLSLATAQPLNSVPTNIVVTKGIGKVMVVVNAGSDIAGAITVTGETIDRITGASSPGDTDTITVDALTTDGSDTDTNGNARYSFSGAYITSKWFTGTVTLSTADLTLTDVDVYHVSFEQFNDSPNITLNTFDANIFTTNVAAEFDAYLYTLEVTTGKCTVERTASLNVGADGETAIADKYWRLRKGNLAKALDGTTDGIWADVFYSNSPAYVEDVNIKIWATKTTSMTIN